MDPDFDGSDGPDRWQGKTQTETAELKRQDEDRPLVGAAESRVSCRAFPSPDR
ncbi:hypothetical protein RCH10_000436 [Variovorax sp. GrIS 2.14]